MLPVESQQLSDPGSPLPSQGLYSSPQHTYTDLQQAKGTSCCCHRKLQHITSPILASPGFFLAVEGPDGVGLRGGSSSAAADVTQS